MLLAVTTWAADLCPVFLAHIAVSEHESKITELVARKSFAQFHGSAEVKPIVDAIATLGSIDFNKSFQLSGNAREENEVLIIRLTGIGPRLGTPLPPMGKGELKGVMAGHITPYVRNGIPKATMIKALTAVIEGVNKRLAANPQLKKVRFETIDVANYHLKTMLTEKLGFSFLYSRTIGLAESANTYDLEIKLAPPQGE